HASGEIDIGGGRVDGDVNFGEGHFRHSKAPFDDNLTGMNFAIDAAGVEVKHGVVLCCGFESDGAVNLSAATIGGDLIFGGGRFVNPNNIAFTASDRRTGRRRVLAL